MPSSQRKAILPTYSPLRILHSNIEPTFFETGFLNSSFNNLISSRKTILKLSFKKHFFTVNVKFISSWALLNLISVCQCFIIKTMVDIETNDGNLKIGIIPCNIKFLFNRIQQSFHRKRELKEFIKKKFPDNNIERPISQNI